MSDIVIKDTQKGRDALHAAGFKWASGDDMREWGKFYIGQHGATLIFDLKDQDKRVFSGQQDKRTHKVVKAAENVFVFVPR